MCVPYGALQGVPRTPIGCCEWRSSPLLQVGCRAMYGVGRRGSSGQPAAQCPLASRTSAVLGTPQTPPRHVPYTIAFICARCLSSQRLWDEMVGGAAGAVDETDSSRSRSASASRLLRLSNHLTCVCPSARPEISGLWSIIVLVYRPGQRDRPPKAGIVRWKQAAVLILPQCAQNVSKVILLRYPSRQDDITGGTVTHATRSDRSLFVDQ